MRSPPCRSRKWPMCSNCRPVWCATAWVVFTSAAAAPAKSPTGLTASPPPTATPAIWACRSRTRRSRNCRSSAAPSMPNTARRCRPWSISSPRKAEKSCTASSPAMSAITSATTMTPTGCWSPTRMRFRPSVRPRRAATARPMPCAASTRSTMCREASAARCSRTS